jgi:hypothetical protein
MLGVMQAAPFVAPPLWQPADLGSKLLAFWDAEDAVSLELDGSAVSSWTDRRLGVAPRGPELLTNGDFADASVWTPINGASISGGDALLPPGSTAGISQPITVTVGQMYEVRFDYTKRAGAATVRFTGGSNADAPQFNPAVGSGHYRGLLTAVSGNNTFRINGTNGTIDVDIDNVSVKAVFGYSASQVTAASRPAYSATGLNGRPCISFDGTDDWLRMGLQPFPTGGDIEIWSLADQQSGTAGQKVFLTIGASSVNTAIRAGKSNTSSPSVQVGAGTSNVVVLQASGFSNINAYRARITATHTDVQLNDTTMTPVATTSAIGTTSTTIGGNSTTTPANLWLGSINSLLVTQLLTAPEAANLLAWLKARGGIA